MADYYRHSIKSKTGRKATPAQAAALARGRAIRARNLAAKKSALSGSGMAGGGILNNLALFNLARSSPPIINVPRSTGAVAEAPVARPTPPKPAKIVLPLPENDLFNNVKFRQRSIDTEIARQIANEIENFGNRKYCYGAQPRGAPPCDPKIFSDDILREAVARGMNEIVSERNSLIDRNLYPPTAPWPFRIAKAPLS